MSHNSKVNCGSTYTMSHRARLLVNLSLKNTHSDNSCFEDAKRRKITYPQEIADHSGNGK